MMLSKLFTKLQSVSIHYTFHIDVAIESGSARFNFKQLVLSEFGQLHSAYNNHVPTTHAGIPISKRHVTELSHRTRPETDVAPCLSEHQAFNDE
jgi:hypothetical protein